MIHETYKLYVSVFINKIILAQPNTFIYILFMTISGYSSRVELLQQGPYSSLILNMYYLNLDRKGVLIPLLDDFKI